MTRSQAFAVLMVGILFIAAALTWRFGWLGLLPCGIVITLYALGVDQEEPEKEVTRDDE